MSLPLMILITGLPCTGKTVLGKRLAEEFSLPMLTKDGIKEVLFDTLGWCDRAWSKKLSSASNRLLLYFAQVLLSTGQSLILESNFPPQEYTQRVRALKLTCPFMPFQILCVADGSVLIERFRQRWESGVRHPGHVDDQSFEEIRQTLLPGRLDPLEIGGRLVEIDTTHFENIDYPRLIHEINVFRRPTS